MTVVELLNDLQARDVRLGVRGDRLAYDAPAGAMTPYVRTILVARKAEVLAVLAGDWYAAAMAVLDWVRDPDRHADLRYVFEERAGIAEYDGGLPRPQAERVAYAQLAAAETYRQCGE
jgi:hypothetical protein